MRTVFERQRWGEGDQRVSAGGQTCFSGQVCPLPVAPSWPQGSGHVTGVRAERGHRTHPGSGARGLFPISGRVRVPAGPSGRGPQPNSGPWRGALAWLPGSGWRGAWLGLRGWRGVVAARAVYMRGQARLRPSAAQEVGGRADHPELRTRPLHEHPPPPRPPGLVQAFPAPRPGPRLAACLRPVSQKQSRVRWSALHICSTAGRPGSNPTRWCRGQHSPCPRGVPRSHICCCPLATREAGREG